MTMYAPHTIAVMSSALKGKIVREFEYEVDGDYFVITFEKVDGVGTSEICFRFMADLEQETSGGTD